VEFAKALVQYSKSSGAPLHDIIDYMSVTALADNPSTNSNYQDAYRKSINMTPILLVIDDMDDDATPTDNENKTEGVVPEAPEASAPVGTAPASSAGAAP
jgi:hypothetical protein